MKVNKKRTSRCPSCGERISIGERPKIGQYLLCSICDEKVEIIEDVDGNRCRIGHQAASDPVSEVDVRAAARTKSSTTAGSYLTAAPIFRN